jgi:hypothetical protein
VLVYLLLYACSRFGLVTAVSDKISGSYILSFFLKFIPS